MPKMKQSFFNNTSLISAVVFFTLASMTGFASGSVFPNPYEIEFEPLSFSAIEPSIESLDNGMEFWFLPDHTLPVITLIIDMDVGNLLDPEDKVGLAELTSGTLVRGGTESLTAMEFAETTELMGVRFGANTDNDYTQISVTCLSTDLHDALTLLMDVMQTPRFDSEQLGLVRSATQESIMRMEQQPFFMTFNTLRQRLYGADHPSARIPDRDVLDTITRDDLITFHQAYYHPNISRFAVIGAADDDAIDYIKNVVSSWTGETTRSTDWPEPQPVSDTATVLLVDRPGTQAAIAIGHLGLESKHPQRYNLEIFNEIYGGGGMSSRLMNRVRTQKGLAYVVFGSHILGTPKGTFFAACMTQNNTVVEAIETILDVTREMKEDLVTDTDIQTTMESIENSFIFRFERPRQVLQRLLVYRRRGLPLDYLETYLDSLREVTAESLREAARETIHLDKIQIVVAGPVDVLKPELEKLGYPIEVITRN
jgi:zinc protease